MVVAVAVATGANFGGETVCFSCAGAVGVEAVVVCVGKRIAVRRTAG